MAALLVVAAVAVGLAAAGPAEPRIAVLEFTNAAPSGELDALGKGLQSMVTTDLAQLPAVKIVERARLADLRGELRLGASGLVDASTASRVGKLAGATHLLAGSFTVVGARMRLDGRLFAVDSGALLLAESIEGEKDAFFELEKSLVARIVDKLGVKLQPRERAALARPHTTDFEAFQSFSQGVALFDEKKYDESIAALRAATSRDADFKLAGVTLAEYQRVIAEVRSRADELQVSQAQLEVLGRQKAATEEAAILKRLFALAAQQGEAAMADRLAARYAIAEAYGNPDRDWHVLELSSFEDRFALQRTADAYTQSYHAEALGRFPRWPLLVRGEASFPKGLADLDRWFAETRRRLECADADCRGRRAQDLAWWGNVSGRPVSFFARRLHLDAHDEAALHERLYRLAVDAGASVETRTQALMLLANDHRAAGDFARSTQALTQLAGILRDPDKIRKVADALDVDRKATDALARSPQRDLLREAFMLGPAAPQAHALDHLVEPDFVARFATKTPSPQALARLANFRLFPQPSNNGAWVSERYLWVGDAPVWLLQQRAYPDMTFAPRTDRYRAAEIRYYVDAAEIKRNADLQARPVDALLVVEGVPRAEVRLRFTVELTPAADWWPPLVDAYDHTRSLADRGINLEGRPEVGVLFGLQDVDCAEGKDPKDGARVIARPMRGYLLSIDESGARLASIVERGEPYSGMDTPALKRAKALVRQPVGATPLDLRSARRLDVAVSVRGTAVRATINGASVAFTLPAAQPGFYGLAFRGPGYAAVKALQTTRAK
jgi:TolB-like protein